MSKRRTACAILLLAGVAASLESGAAWADACDAHNYNIEGSPSIPDCELQVQSPLKFSPLDSKVWVFHCGGDHLYYWGLAQGYSPAYTFNNTCLTVPENAAAEGSDTSKFDATLTNWCFKSETVTVTLAWSDQEP